MTKKLLRATTAYSAGTVSVAACVSLSWGSSALLGLLAGSLWNLVNLWCMGQAFESWMKTPEVRSNSRLRRLLAWWPQATWFLLKFPLLYGIAIFCLMAPTFSKEAFGIGFVVVLSTALIAALTTLRESTPFSHGS